MMDFNFSKESLELQDRLKTFFVDNIYPNEDQYEKAIIDSGDPLHIPEILNDLKSKAKKENLWNLFLPDNEYGYGLSNVDYAPLAEITGHNWWAPEVFNCSAPDTGNMEILAEFGTDEQKKEWLEPLLEGEIRSCFAMTEPNVASSDATNIGSSIVSDGENYIINGRKWWTSNAINPNAKICIFMGVTNPDSSPYQRQSQVLVPMDSEGLSIIRPMQVFGYDDGYTGHPELLFENVVVPKSNIIGGEGMGFKIAQARLGPGRIHHCMRAIGLAERALEMMCKHGMEKIAFGKPLVQLGGNMDIIANSRIEIDQARLLTLKAAHMMDTVGNKVAASEIAQIKVVAPNVCCDVLDRAIQMHGGAGVSQVYPLAAMYAHMRTLRLADGPDEVHRRAVARQELGKYVSP